MVCVRKGSLGERSGTRAEGRRGRVDLGQARILSPLDRLSERTQAGLWMHLGQLRLDRQGDENWIATYAEDRGQRR